MEKDVIHQGWLEYSPESSSSKSWLKLSSKKTWKRKFLVLYKLVEDTDQIFLAAYDKEEWQTLEPKKTINLFPSYKIGKLFNLKGKEHVLEVSNGVEKWLLSTEKSKIIDLWAVQIQMQMKLSRVISGRIFSISGSVSKSLQKIGAAQQRCLLHITKWGVTLALQDSRAILAMWPLKTIRNYEYTGQCQFTLEAGRRSPMGEGLYMFYTNIGQDEEIFSIIDAFVAASLDEKAQMQPNKKSEITDDDILKCYDELHKSAIGVNEVNTNQGYDRITHSTTHIPLPSREPSLHRPPDYNQLFDNGARQNSMRKEVCAAERDDNYDQLDYKAKHLGLEDDIVSLPSNSYDALLRSDHGNTVESSYDRMNTVESSYDHMNTVESNYDHIDAKQRGASHNTVENNYDHINAAGGNLQVKNLPSTGPVSPKFFPLRDEPSVPFLDDNEVPFTGRSPLSSSVASNKSEYEFRNSIYAPMTDGTPSGSLISAGSFTSTQGLIDLGSRNNSDASQFSRHDSNSSDRFSLSRNKQSRASSSFKDKSIQDIADHFLYQVPSSLSTTLEQTTQSNNNGSLVEEDLYQNHGNASKSLDS